MRRQLCSTLIAFAILGAAVSHDAKALPLRLNSMASMNDVLADRFISPAQAAAVARSVTNGRVLAVHLVGTGPKALYRVRLLVGGQIRIVRVDAHDGRVLR